MDAYVLPDISVPDGVTAVVLAQNEHLFPPSAAVSDAVAAALRQGQLYPDSDWVALRAAIAEVHDLEPRLILCGSGSMELMQTLVSAYVEPGQRILMTEYGYLFMRTLAKLVGARLESAPERDFRVDVDALLARVEADTRLVFVVNPGNPSGSVIHNDEIRRLREGLPDDVILLVDEAYAEFVEPGFHAPLFDLVARGNTVITRTFSKIYGLAGLRAGWGYFPAALGDNLRKVMIPGNLTVLSQAAALAAMRDQDTARAAAAEVARLRRLFSDGISALGFDHVSSQANFVLVDCAGAKRAAAAFDYLRAAGIVVRPMGGYGLPGRLRITVGTEAQMRRTIELLGEWSDRS